MLWHQRYTADEYGVIRGSVFDRRQRRKTQVPGGGFTGIDRLHIIGDVAFEYAFIRPADAVHARFYPDGSWITAQSGITQQRR